MSEIEGRNPSIDPLASHEDASDEQFFVDAARASNVRLRAAQRIAPFTSGRLLGGQTARMRAHNNGVIAAASRSHEDARANNHDPDDSSRKVAGGEELVEALRLAEQFPATAGSNIVAKFEVSQDTTNE